MLPNLRECVDDTGEEDKKIKSVAKKELAYEVDNYVKSSEKFPLEANRWGYLPLVMQVFLQHSLFFYHYFLVPYNLSFFLFVQDYPIF